MVVLWVPLFLRALPGLRRNFTENSPEFDQNFTGIHWNSLEFTGIHQNSPEFTGISNYLTRPRLSSAALLV